MGGRSAYPAVQQFAWPSREKSLGGGLIEPRAPAAVSSR